mmetsp:Transcript_45388/g.116153  ORF Transcript_45388/g.116153 Transcript_45388/m.116153 type:complete len:207 (-) Transcript_45388:565-1185(-)
MPVTIPSALEDSVGSGDDRKLNTPARRGPSSPGLCRCSASWGRGPPRGPRRPLTGALASPAGSSSRAGAFSDGTWPATRTVAVGMTDGKKVGESRAGLGLVGNSCPGMSDRLLRKVRSAAEAVSDALRPGKRRTMLPGCREASAAKVASMVARRPPPPRLERTLGRLAGCGGGAACQPCAAPDALRPSSREGRGGALRLGSLPAAS